MGKVVDQIQLRVSLEEQTQLRQKASQDARLYFEMLLSAIKKAEHTISMWQEVDKHVEDSRKTMALLTNDYEDLRDITVDKVQGKCSAQFGAPQVRLATSSIA